MLQGEYRGGDNSSHVEGRKNGVLGDIREQGKVVQGKRLRGLDHVISCVQGALSTGSNMPQKKGEGSGDRAGKAESRGHRRESWRGDGDINLGFHRRPWLDDR